MSSTNMVVKKEFLEVTLKKTPPNKAELLLAPFKLTPVPRQSNTSVQTAAFVTNKKQSANRN